MMMMEMMEMMDDDGRWWWKMMDDDDDDDFETLMTVWLIVPWGRGTLISSWNTKTNPMIVWLIPYDL